MFKNYRALICVSGILPLVLLTGCPGRSGSSVPREEAVSQSRPLSPVPNMEGYGPVYFVALGNTPPSIVHDLVAYYDQRLGLKAKALAPLRVPAEAMDSERKQFAVQDLIARMKKAHPDKARDYLIGIVDGDIYSRDSGFRFTFSTREWGAQEGAAVISTARMDPAFFGKAPDAALLQSRLRKMVTKNLGVIYYRLPESKDPKSVLYGPVLSLDDIDRMGQGF